MIEVLKQALEAWQTSVYGSDKHHKAMLLAMTKMNQAIAELESQEPVAWADMGTRDVDNDAGLSWTTGHFHTTPLYTHPPQRKPLTDEDVWKALDDTDCTRPMLIARAIEAAHGIKEES